MRSLIVNWSDLAHVHSEGDRLSIFVRDSKTGKMKYIDATICDVLHEGDDGLYNEERQRWAAEHFKESDESQ